MLASLYNLACFFILGNLYCCPSGEIARTAPFILSSNNLANAATTVGTLKITSNIDAEVKRLVSPIDIGPIRAKNQSGVLDSPHGGFPFGTSS